MGLACTCKPQGLVQFDLHQKVKRRLDMANPKCVNFAKKQCSGQHKHIETAIKQYTMLSNAQQVIEQKDLLI